MNTIFKNILTALAFQIIPFIFGSKAIVQRVDPNYWKALLILSILISWIIGLYYYIKYPLPKKVGDNMCLVLFFAGLVTNYGLTVTCTRYFGFEYEGTVELVLITVTAIITLFETGSKVITEEYDPGINGLRKNYFMDYYAIMGYAFYINLLRDAFQEINLHNVIVAVILLFVLVFPFKKYAIAIRLAYGTNQKESPYFIFSLLLVMLSALSVVFGRGIGMLGGF